MCLVVVFISLCNILEDNVGYLLLYLYSYLLPASVLLQAEFLWEAMTSAISWQILPNLAISFQQAGRSVCWDMLWGGISSPCVGTLKLPNWCTGAPKCSQFRMKIGVRCCADRAGWQCCQISGWNCTCGMHSFLLFVEINITQPVTS